MSSSVDDNNSMKCASCGKGGDGLKACNACKLVKYCNATCQRAHWSRHKKECKKRAAELHDEALFKEPLEREECDICMLPMPLRMSEQKYQPCCGKVLCYGCIHAAYTADTRQLCPFCRTPHHTSDKEYIERLKKRAEDGDAIAMHNLGGFYRIGRMGLPQDLEKAMELWLKAGGLGHGAAQSSVANAYLEGLGIERDMKKAKYYWELAAMRGDEDARHNLGVNEERAGNIDRAIKHWMIAAGAGKDSSLGAIRKCFMHGLATKDDYEKGLRAHKEAKDEMKSDHRDAAAAATSPDGIR